MVYLKKLETIYLKYERRLLPVAFFLGFVWDSLTLRRIDFWFENLVFIVHLFILGLAIFILNTKKSEQNKLSNFIPEKVAEYVPLIMQFSFGALFSAFFVFYSRSSSFVASWPFLVLLFGMLVGNEVFRKKYSRFVFQLSVYFVVVFSYFIFAIPVLIGKMGALVFVMSGLASLVFIYLFAHVLSIAKIAEFRKKMRVFSFSVFIIYLFFNILYFTNIIPPIPLSVKEIGVYHSVVRNSSGNYVVSAESIPWYYFYKDSNPNFHWKKGAPVYVFSAVFAPTKIDTKIFHKWEYFDEEKGAWIEVNKIGFAISGGRKDGYRGYTMKSSVMPGKWRVDVITERGQVVGRTNFEVIEDMESVEMEAKIK
ncbi:MAG: DUF2914 domain-containing protein [Candidatus Marinimicrobia bacterium]|nr:DUF2914 domain-containing protein [Candidatus Neomarinimicrobiota bacterium]